MGHLHNNTLLIGQKHTDKHLFSWIKKESVGFLKRKKKEKILFLAYWIHTLDYQQSKLAMYKKRLL